MHQLHVPGIRQLDHVVWAVQHCHERRALLEELGESVAFGGEPAFGQHPLSGLRTDHQNAADAVRRLALVDGAVTVGPVDVLEFAVANDGDQRVLVPGRRIAAHDLVDLGTNDGPDFRPRLRCGPPENRRMLLRTQGTPVCVVVKAHEIGPPEYENWMASG